jgi:O-antigen/teichoic acid export membrane protein
MLGSFEKTRRKLKQSKEANVLIENFLSLSFLKIFEYVFPLITLPYLARVIGVEKFGKIAFAGAIIVYFQTLVDFGFNYTAVRDIARNRDDIVSLSKHFCTIMATRILLMFISFIILTICIFTIPSFYENRLILILTFLYVPGYILFPDWFFQAMEQMKYITVTNLLSKLLFTGLVFVVIKKQSDYIYQPVLIALGYILVGIISMPLIVKKYKIKLSIPSLGDIFLAIKGSWNMFISLFVPNLYTNFSIILLNSYSGLIPTGLYSSGYKFIDLVNQLSNVLSRAFYPFLARHLDKHKTYVIISMTISLFAGLCLFFGADLLTKIFYTTEFEKSAMVIKIMAICPFFLMLMNTYGPNYLVLVGKENILRNIIIFCSLGGFILSWIFVTRFSYIGVAVTITIVWGIRGFITWFYASRYKNHLVTSL